MRVLLALAALAFGRGAAWGAPQPNPGDPGHKTRLIIGFQPNLTAEQRDQLVAGLNVVDRIGAPIHMAVVEIPKGTVGMKSLQQLGTAKGVAVVEEDFYTNWLQESPAGFVQEPLISPALQDLEAKLQRLTLASAKTGEAEWGIRKVHAPEVWDKSDPKTQGDGVRVAVVDTGIDCELPDLPGRPGHPGHPDLSCNADEGFNAVDPDPKAEPKDDNGHGTHVAGIIAAKWDDKGVVGVAPLAHLIPVKVLNAKGEGFLSDILKGIAWCADHQIQVINMSLGSVQGSTLEHLTIQYARREKGVTIVAAAGNHHPNKPKESAAVSFPGAYEEVISAAASDIEDKVAAFSNHGREVKFIAPGVDVKSSIPGGRYARHSGTSMATPHVAGLAALAIAQGAGTPDQVFETLKSAAARLDGASPEEQGFGMIDARRIVHKTLAAAR